MNQTNSSNIKTQVVIVGGGITGIAAALFLAQYTESNDCLVRLNRV